MPILAIKDYFRTFAPAKAELPVICLGKLMLTGLMRAFDYIPALIVCMIAMGALELLFFALFRLYSPKELLKKFFGKKRKKTAPVLLTTVGK